MDLFELVGHTLQRCQKLGLPNRQCDPQDPEVLEAYVTVLEARRISPDAFRRSLPEVFSCKFFPTPGALVELALPHQAAIDEQRRVMELRGLVECEDDEGRLWLAPPERVENGRLLPAPDRALPSADPRRSSLDQRLASLAAKSMVDDGSRGGERA